jgi:hypothetical protein
LLKTYQHAALKGMATQRRIQHKELCRIANEVRIFPLLELGARKSRHLNPIIDRLTVEGYAVNIVPVPYEFQRGGDKMMKITTCGSGDSNLTNHRKGKK